MSNLNGRKILVTTEDSPYVVESSKGDLSITIPISFKRQSGKKIITLPNGENYDPRPWDNSPTPLQLALARGYYWLGLLESKKAKSMREIAEKEGIDNSYVSRMINLTTLAPDIIQAILDDKLPDDISLFDLAVDPPRLWAEQRERFKC